MANNSESFNFSEKLLEALHNGRKTYMLYSPKEKKFYSGKGMSSSVVTKINSARQFAKTTLKSHLGMWKSFFVGRGSKYDRMPYDLDNDEVIEYKLIPVRKFKIREFYAKKDWVKEK